eukprot:CAMPEP_0184708258 /NCGR_PEP_ID=MMETSP0313-20130426/37684_1 /TAXON_ID=2792 /ORGANISM="Porphyridium aerugineum, Strain SAG 1380-2" /LENGTH=1010 /DNA_ID=CAMNT_0027169843 /DNA_START=931 /DNA_END=3963 /DNA_ORIENTATION=+
MADTKEGQVVVDIDDHSAPAGSQTGEPNDEYFKRITQQQALKELNSNTDGLPSSEIEARVAKYGKNNLPEKKDNKFFKFLQFMWNPLSWAMEIAAIISIALVDYVDFILIICLLFVNAIIGYYEENNAANAIDALMKSLAPEAKVKRDGKFKAIPAEDLVPGDIVLIRLGDVLPADVKILGEKDSEPCLIDQAALTGESLPAKKFPGDVAFSGSIMKQGEVEAVVYATGMDTFFGKAAALIGATNNAGHLQQVMTAIGSICLVTIAVWVAIELGVQFGHYKHPCGGGEGMCNTLSNMLVILVGGIPIAMPTVLSVTLALGAYSLSGKGAIVARMTAVEELAGMDILCSDKTGTLTLNVLSVDASNLDPKSGFSKPDILMYGALSAKIENHEPIDVCIHESYEGKDQLWEHFVCVKYQPFNPVIKRTVAFIKATDDVGKSMVRYPEFRVCKGAPQIVLGLSHNVEEIRKPVEERILEYASRGYRALGVAVAEGLEGTEKWEFVGLCPIFDPPRHDTAETIRRAQELGIGVKMITGDQLPIGKETARLLGMGTNMFTTEVFREGGVDGKGLVQGTVTLDQLVEEADGFAEVFPEHKYDIVRRLQDLKHITGMTGDGVNDAPALKKADIGIAVADATDAARAAADIVLTEPGLSVIIDAVIGSREIFQRMKSYAKYTISMTFRITFTFGLLTVIYDWYFPTILIVMLAIFNDGAMIALSKDNVKYSPLPDQWKLSKIFIAGIIYGLYLTLSSWVLFHVAGYTNFFEGMGLPDLRWSDSVLNQSCESFTGTDFSTCTLQRLWERQSMMRALIYGHVSISGMALIFTVRTKKHSFLDRPCLMLVIAFFFSQVVACLVCGLGLNAYPWPIPSVPECTYCQHGLSTKAPDINDPEGIFTGSVIGSQGYVLVAIIWSIIWYIPLDFIKFFLMWAMNEDGMRNASIWSRPFLEDLGFVGYRGSSDPASYVLSGRPSSASNPRASSAQPASRMSTATARSRASQAGASRRSVTRDAGIYF